ncbi:type VI secretion system accessory protein TagJ [Advenella alkanexedens]|uniref:type VI secretion system accessory protein TagJ n=1 Tax=Advenella alkanexedens TaxID=1481665 RepID=UPI0026757365|nr:type VI secretion system accessory protein TagJ [Advenella alkanexedens]WKU19520.1 type VI secretion system accessory protein TagJ [Advenella alkanexedens]
MSQIFMLRSFDNQALNELVDGVKAAIRKKPSDADLRAQLFQLLAVQGAWDKAFEQLTLSAEMNAQAQPLAVVYGGAIRAEQERQAVFNGEKTPAVLAEPPAWMAMLIEALKTPDAIQAAQLRALAMENAPAIAGQLELNGQDQALAFEWLCDGDGRLGPVCELIVNGRYGWFPFGQIARIGLIAPQGLTDLLWAQAEIELHDGRSYAGLIPVRYPAPSGKSYAMLDDAANLARRTAWQPLSENVYAGVGQKMWLLPDSEQAILDVHSVRFDRQPDISAAEI